MATERIPAIPTTYNGVRFRSRLEARWAAFFDRMQWRWAYEPVDLAGWIPDFVVGPVLTTGAYVEVKPIDWGDPDSVRLHSKELDHAKKVVPASSRGFIVLGLQPDFSYLNHDGVGRVGLGLVCKPQYPDRGLSMGSLSKSLSDGRFDIPVNGSGGYPGLFTGVDYNEAGSSPAAEPYYAIKEIESAWKDASNAVQWKGRS